MSGEWVVARWKALPDGLDPAVVRLIVELRRIKDASRLSMAQLADRTGYSESSWERYLNGRAMPPREAVDAVLVLGHADAMAVTVLRDVADQAWRDAVGSEANPRAEDAMASESEQTSGTAVATASAPSRRLRRRPSPRTVVNSVVSAGVGAALTLLFVNPSAHSSAASPAAAKVAHSVATTKPVTYTCNFTQTNGKWYAGESTTDTDLVVDGYAGPEVAEVQCLLEHAGISPGGVDGMFGPHTLSALLKLQIARHLDIDGQVGPQTWAALRG
jgi:transcriptional regulator with XRE-family HTH domain